LVLQDEETLHLYRNYISQSIHPSLVNHIDFFQDLSSVEKATIQPKSNKLLKGEPLSYNDIYNKYFLLNEPQHLLEIKQDIIAEVRDNVTKGGFTAQAFKPALLVVVKDLCFSDNLTSFTDSAIFQEFKSYLSSSNSEVFNLPAKERNFTLRLRKIFGEKISPQDAAHLRYRTQPRHVKSFKLNKRFGERVLVEHDEVKPTTIDNIQDEETLASLFTQSCPGFSTEWRRSRRLHVFFGDHFEIDDVLFSEKIRAPLEEVNNGNEVDETKNITKQPDHVHPHRLNRFFGERVPRENTKNSGGSATGDSDDLSAEQHHMDTDDKEPDLKDESEIDEQPPPPSFLSSRSSKTQRIMRFFGERMDPIAEASHKSFADQPANVRPLKLKKIFGTPSAGVGANSDTMEGSNVHGESGASKKTKRAHKLHKFFGTSVKDVKNLDLQNSSPRLKRSLSS